MKIRLAHLAIILVYTFQLNYAQDITYARNIIQSLTSENFYGRGYVKGGIDSAANYIASQFSDLGLCSVNNSYFQNFTIDVNTFPGRMEFKSLKTRFNPGTDFITDPSSAGIKGRYKTFWIKNIQWLDSNLLLTNPKMKNKIVIIDNRIADSLSKKDKEEIAVLTYFLKFSSRIPSAGTIELTNDKLNWGVSTWISPKLLINANLQGDKYPGNKISLCIDNNYLTNYQVKNVIGYLPGLVKPDSFILITAHYDHLGMMGNSTYFSGANDNASGIALMLKLAEYFLEKGSDYSLFFIAFTAEEAGLLGSQYFASHTIVPLEKVKFMLNFDLAGTGDEGIKVVNATVFPDEFNLLEKINSEYNLLPSVQKRGEACNSDHCPLYLKGVPGFYIYTLGGIKAYHDIYDKYETLPLTEFEDYTTLICKFIEEL